MTATYTVKGEYLFITDAPETLSKITRGFEEALRMGQRFRSMLRDLGENEGSLRRISRHLKEIDGSSLSNLSGEARSAALSFDGITSAIHAARDQMRELIAEAGRLSSVHINTPSSGGAGGGGSEGSGRGGAFGGARRVIGADIPGFHSPGLATFMGGTLAYEGLKTGFNSYAAVQQVYDTMLSDNRLRTDPLAMRAVRESADLNLSKYRTLSPLDAARNASEGYALSGGELAEQGAITDMLGRVEESMILRGKSGEDAQRQAAALIKGMDVGNRFYDRKTGQFDTARANKEADTLLAQMNVSGGFTTGNSIQSFFRSAGTMGQDISAEGLARMTHFIEVNPKNAAQALKSFINLFEHGARRMAKKDREAWIKAGLFRPDGSLPEEAETMLHTDTIGFAEKYLSRFDRGFISSHIQRQNVGSILNETQGSTGNINRQAAAVARQDAAAGNDALKNSPAGSVKLLDAAIARFSVTAGMFEAGPGVHILTQITDEMDKATKYLTAHPDSVAKFAKDVETIVGGLVWAASGIAKIGTLIPDWMRPILLGGAMGAGAASVIPGLGTAAGAGIGATLAAMKEYWGHLQSEGLVKTRDDRAIPAMPNGASHVSISVPLHIDGKHVATAVAPHIDLINQSRSRASLRSTSSGFDGLSAPQFPGVAVAH